MYSLFSDLPSSGPKILGVYSKYQVGDQITVSCISPLSFPPAVLRWYINSDSADPSFVSNQLEMTIHQDKPIFSTMNMISELESFMNLKSENDPSVEPHEYFQSSSLNHLSEESLNTPSVTRKRLNKIPHHKRKPAPYSVLKLNFTVKPKHLAHTAGGLSLKCTAEVLDIYWRSSEVETWSLPAFSHSVSANMDIRSFLFFILSEAILIFFISI